MTDVKVAVPPAEYCDHIQRAMRPSRHAGTSSSADGSWCLGCFSRPVPSRLKSGLAWLGFT